MFDDPRKELKRLEAELLAAEAEEETLPEFPDMLAEDEDEDWLQEARALMEEETAPRHSRQAADFRRMAYADEEFHEGKAMVVQKQRKKSKERKQEKQGAGCLPVLAALELAGIAVLAWWWYRWLR